MTAYFGKKWDAPVTDGAPQVETPVGTPCLWCGELIQEGDRGLIYPMIHEDRTSTLKPVHIECSMREVVGSMACLEKRCSHCSGGPDSPEYTRADALAVWDWVREHGL